VKLSVVDQEPSQSASIHYAIPSYVNHFMWSFSFHNIA